LSLSAGGFKVAVPGRAEPRLVTDATGGESKWQGTWYTLVDTGSGPSCTGVLGTESWPATFAKDWNTGPVFATYSDNLCFGATITVYVRQSGAYHFDLKNVDDGARLFDANGNVLFEASCGSFNCPVQSGKDVNLAQGKSELGLQFWQYAGKASVSFLATDASIFRNAPPIVSFTYSPSTIYVGDSVSFSDNSVDPDGDAMNHQWTIGGVSDSQSGPTHTFGTAGSYPIPETVTDEWGGKYRVRVRRRRVLPHRCRCCHRRVRSYGRSRSRQEREGWPSPGPIASGPDPRKRGTWFRMRTAARH